MQTYAPEKYAMVWLIRTLILNLVSSYAAERPVVCPRLREVSPEVTAVHASPVTDFYVCASAPRSLAKHYFDEQVQTPSEVDGSLYSASAYSAYSAAVS
jgi:hypothetical protein